MTRSVVDEENIGRVGVEGLERDRVDARVGFGVSDLAGQDDGVHDVQGLDGRDELADHGEGCGRAAGAARVETSARLLGLAVCVGEASLCSRGEPFAAVIWGTRVSLETCLRGPIELPTSDDAENLAEDLSSLAKAANYLRREMQAE